MKLNKTFKKAISLLLTIIMILSTMVVGMVTVNADSTVTVYVIPSSYLSNTHSYYKLNVKRGDNDWQLANLTSTGTTFGGKAVYSATFTEKYGGLDEMQVWGCTSSTTSSNPSEFKTIFSSWNTTDVFSGKIWDGDSWETYVADATVEDIKVYIAPSNHLTSSYNYYKLNVQLGDTGDGLNEWEIVDLTATNTTVNGKAVYEATIPVKYNGLYTMYLWGCDTANASTATKQTTIFYQTWNSDTTFENKFWNGTSWVTYSPDENWYVTGRFAIKDQNNNIVWAKQDASSNNWCGDKTSNLKMTKDSANLFKLETGLSINEIVADYAGGNSDLYRYFRFADGSTTYYPTANTSLQATNEGTKYSLSTTSNNLYFSSTASSTELVTLWLDTSSSSPKFYFTLGSSTTTVNVPNVVGKTQEEAKTAIEALGLVASITESYSSTVAAGTVISINPSAGTSVEAGSTVNVVVSKGPEPTDPNKVTITNVVGKTQAEATTILTDLGLTVKVTEAYSDKVPAGNVISSNPIAGSSVNKGSEVTITVSKGPEETVPPSTDPTVPSGTVLNNVKVYFKGTNLTSLTPSLTVNGNSYTLAKDNYIGTYFNGSYRFYWWTTTISTVTVGQTYTFNFRTSGSSMNATADIDFSVYNEDDNAIYLAVDNMQTGTEIVNISNNDTAKKAFRSSANMITNVTSQFDPNKKLASAMLTLLNADGTTTTKKYSIGDTNADGSVNIKDATTAQMMSAGYVQTTSTNSILGDFDISGDVNIKDSTGIQTYIVYN